MLSLTATRRAQRKMHDRGQTLLLAPIALLIIMILGAVTLEVWPYSYSVCYFNYL